MNTSNWVMLSLILILGGVAAWKTAVVFQTRNTWEKAVEDHLAATEKAVADTDKLLDGTDSEPGGRRMDSLLKQELNLRGMAWKDGVPSQFTAVGTTGVSFKMTLPPETTAATPLENNMVVYVFSAPKNEDGTAAPGGEFLGIFQIRASQSGVATLESTDPMSDGERQRLQTVVMAGTPCYVLKTAPTDRENQVDFATLLASRIQERNILQNRLKTAENDLATLNTSLTQAQDEQQEIRKDIDLLKRELAAMQGQEQEVKSVLSELDKLVADIQQKIAEQQRKNEESVENIGRTQLQAVEAIERQGGFLPME